MPSPYILVANSRATTVDDDLWSKFYSEEHIPDVISCGVATKGLVYKETFDYPGAPPTKREPLNFTVIYQSPHQRPLSTPGAAKIRHDSDVLPRPSLECGEVDVRQYELIQEYDPLKTGDDPAPVILWVEIEVGDEEDMDQWYRKEHLDMVAKIPGHRRSLRYKAGNKIGGMTQPIKYLGVNDFDTVDGFGGKEFAESAATEWAKKVKGDVKAAKMRVFKLERAVGYGEPRTAKI
ncbi:hypothetical protein P152DRAFT_474826 [Eremomyces bilateralis CBS 781.70]|uniref:EthD domain-containing protein n=1 Tax=Eremomyces bilateralis CBS 781.70 TaxID=1392243 RepID=A0A6G1FZJ2_9PEZI|nr:uncharacterized protein P152DRAFT_474826 [Eremomyces bilateralis CBS 781.70]KAF1811214.1 hypothetical protein P152DRAFT_474826 [Eremomyces bilateralis CBS 781.70]